MLRYVNKAFYDNVKRTYLTDCYHSTLYFCSMCFCCSFFYHFSFLYCILFRCVLH